MSYTHVPVLAKIMLAKGTKAAYVDLVKRVEEAEAELLLERNSIFIIKDRYIDKNGVYWVVLERVS